MSGKMLIRGEIFDQAAGRESRSAFIAMAAFWLAAAKFVMNGVEVTIFKHSVNLGTVDAGLMGAFLAPCLALYWGRRLVFGNEVKPEKVEPVE